MAFATGRFPSASLLLLAMVFGAVVELSDGKVYKVGDSAGWTIIGNVNYTAWATSKSFHVGDTILFVYNKQFHNVLEVSKANYKACNSSFPHATHTSGNDSITLKRRGHFFFFCGFPGRCQMGQKVDIRIPKKLSSSAATISVSPSQSPSPIGVSPSSQKSRCSPGRNGARVGWFVVGLVAWGTSITHACTWN